MPRISPSVRRHDLADISLDAVDDVIRPSFSPCQRTFPLQQIQPMVKAGSADLRPAQIHGDDFSGHLALLQAAHREVPANRLKACPRAALPVIITTVT